MLMDKRYHLPNLLKEYQQYKHHIHAYIKGEVVEDYITENYNENSLFSKLGVGGWIATAIVVILLWVVAIWFLLREWPAIGLVGALLSIVVLIIPGLGPLASIVITVIASGTGGWGQKLNKVLSAPPLIGHN